MPLLALNHPLMELDGIGDIDGNCVMMHIDHIVASHRLPPNSKHVKTIELAGPSWWHIAAHSEPGGTGRLILEDDDTGHTLHVFHIDSAVNAK